MRRAYEIMTRDVVSVGPETPVDDVARTLLTHGISAVPVLDAGGKPVGMVSEGDIIGPGDGETRDKRDWWLELVAEGETISPEFLASLRRGRLAHHVMRAPVVTVTRSTDVAEIARLLGAYGIKRVPVVDEDGRVVGIVSRADLLRALADETSPAPSRSGHGHGLLGALGGHLLHPAGDAAPLPAPPPREERLTAAQFRSLAADHSASVAARRAAEREREAEQRRTKVKELIDHHVGDGAWHRMLHKARDAAQRGENEALLFRFPAALCSDGGRAINMPEPDWPTTLRGEAAEVYLRWQRDLKPQGFGLAARVLDFPGGLPGDVGMFLIWGE